MFATGVIEQPAVFRNNDLPGVMLGVRRGSSAVPAMGSPPAAGCVMVAANLEAYTRCLELQRAGRAVDGHRRSAPPD